MVEHVKKLCCRWIKFIRYIPHHTPLAVKHTFHQYLSLTEHKNWSPPVVWNKCLIFSRFHALINTRVDLPRLLLLLYSPHMVLPCLIRKIYSSRTCLCASECCTSFPSFSMVHSPKCLIACRGLSTCSYKTRHISLAVSYSELIPHYFNTYWTTEYGSSPIERAGNTYERHAKIYGTTFVL